MSNKTTEVIEKDQDTDQDQESTALTVPSSQALAGVDDGFEIGLQNVALVEALGHIDDLLKQASVTEFTGARILLNKRVSLLDSFPFEMLEESKETPGTQIRVPKVMLVVSDEAGLIHHVMQNANPSRERYIAVYEAAKAANVAAGTHKALRLTNMEFREVGSPKFGNKPIILGFTPETQQIWSDVLPA